MPNAFLKEEVTELLMTADTAPADQTGERKQYGEKIFFETGVPLFLAFAVDPVVNVVSRTAAVTAAERSGCL